MLPQFHHNFFKMKYTYFSAYICLHDPPSPQTNKQKGCTALEVLFLSDNMLHGKFPGEALACLSHLRELDLSRNQLVGALAVEMPSRLRKCERLLLNDNQLGGRLPSTLMDLVSCRELNISNNG
jgi:hypothetical protein